MAKPCADNSRQRGTYPVFARFLSEPLARQVAKTEQAALAADAAKIEGEQHAKDKLTPRGRTICVTDSDGFVMSAVVRSALRRASIVAVAVAGS